MQARQLLDGAAFGPETLKVIGQAFDEAWAQIASNIGTEPVVVESARMTLANAILSAAKDTSRNVDALKTAGLRAMGARDRPPVVGEPKTTT